jgi:RIO1 family
MESRGHGMGPGWSSAYRPNSQGGSVALAKPLQPGTNAMQASAHAISQHCLYAAARKVTPRKGPMWPPAALPCRRSRAAPQRVPAHVLLRPQKLESRMNMRLLSDHAVDSRGGQHNLGPGVATAVRVNAERRLRADTRDKSDRATVEQALDPRTRMVLFKMLNSGLFQEINGCISTGKEANVYHAATSEGRDLAIKVYKTSILVFKDRDRCRADFL